MKKEYIKPEALAVELLVGGMLAMSGTDLGGEGEPFANERRSGWDDPWN